MIRTLVWLVALAIAIAGGAWLADRPGHVTLIWQDWRVDTSVAVLVLALAAFTVTFAVLYRLWLVIRHAPRALIERRRMARRERGYRALTAGMVAVAAGDAEEAATQAKRADALLHEPPLTMLLSAQAAQLAGDDAAAARYFTAMLERDETAFMGVRGLLAQAERAGDRPRALALARRAYALRPNTPWVMNTLFELQVKEGAWREALATLDQAAKRGAMRAPEVARQRAAVLLQVASQQDDRAAADFVRRAHEGAPDFLPAAIRYAELLYRIGSRRAANRIVERAYARTAHPDLVRLYSTQPGATTEERLKLERRLMELNPARPDATLPGRAWVCEACRAAASSWTPLCVNCGALASLDWKQPERVHGIARPAAAAGAVSGPAAPLPEPPRTAL